MRFVARLGLWSALLSCTQTSNLVSDDELAPLDAGLLDATTRADAATPTRDGGFALCGGKPCACDNDLDDDGDGLPDGLDSECTGPHDNDEATFATGQKPDGSARCSDCFFDGNGGYDDGCQIAAQCAVDGTPGNAPGSCNQCTPSAKCIERCQVLTPNGCDCFGCCEVRRGAEVVNVQLVDTCSLGALDDLASCPRCLPQASCRNECGRCELCPGKRLADLPSDCAQANGLPYQCDEGEACADSASCVGLQYCGQGCCLPVVF